MIQCQTCGKETANPKFCSKSCSAKTTNKTNPKRKPIGKCLTCNKSVHSTKKYCSIECKPEGASIYITQRRKLKCKICSTIIEEPKNKYCNSCKDNPIIKSRYSTVVKVLSKNKIITKEDIELAMEKRRKTYIFHATIRGNSRKVYYDNFDNKSCERCGYSKHIEVCHVKQAKDFEENTPLEIVNDFNNLVGLCPNCHWELDHQMFDITEIERFKILLEGIEPPQNR